MVTNRVACAALVVALLVGCAAEPAPPVTEPTAGVVEDGRAILEELLATYRAAASYSHICTWSTVTTRAGEREPWSSEEGAATRFLFERPDRFVVESPESAIYCDGKTLWTWDRQRDEYVATPLAEVEPPPFALSGIVELGHPAAAAAHMLLVDGEDRAGEPVEPLFPDGGTYTVVEEVRHGLDGRWVQVAARSSAIPRISMWIDDDTGLVLAWEMTMSSVSRMTNDEGALERFDTRLSITCREVELDPDIPDEAFRFRPDAEAREVDRAPTPGLG